MAISEACKYEIEEDVDKACEEKGIPKKEAFETLQNFYNALNIPITFSAIKSKYYRAKEDSGKVANATPKSKPPETIELFLTRAKKLAKLAQKIKSEPSFESRKKELLSAANLVAIVLTETREDLKWV